MPPFTSIVTGANQGIGLEIARQLVRRPDSRTVVAARNPERGQAAVADLKSHLPAADIRFHQLDITDADSVQVCGATHCRYPAVCLAGPACGASTTADP